ncbi:integrase catalytic domain-containing protein [Trichonephila inaurata madagascariensis]|uniref:Integrase catalytic domain-containing protein n=1 Tax=Trichonephila inaurata madagascariensis TaxID=2747483 RepID=A0A8X7CS16_9ARAC|nr:integrase catalytic domain-containing protein [Trichonephila inaurata madagascariensis]
MAEFSNLYQTEDNRKVVSLPWKSIASTLPTNMAKAKKKRFDSLQKRLASNYDLKKEYERGMCFVTAYSSLLYIVTVKGDQSNVHLVCSRNRLAPIRKITFPHLELLAALMGARLLRYLCAETNICPSKKEHYGVILKLF